jgi:hypothetical protein
MVFDATSQVGRSATTRSPSTVGNERDTITRIDRPVADVERQDAARSGGARDAGDTTTGTGLPRAARAAAGSSRRHG